MPFSSPCMILSLVRAHLLCSNRVAELSVRPEEQSDGDKYCLLDSLECKFYFRGTGSLQSNAAVR